MLHGRSLGSRYDRIAGLYDGLSRVYSAGAIARAKDAHLLRIERGQQVLYVGAGTASECSAAARLGARVTVCDVSAKMLELARARFRAEKLPADFWHHDALQAPKGGARFDAVVAPFFLNVFSKTKVVPVIDALSRYLAPGGLLVSVDFRRPSETWFSLLQRLHYLPPLLLFALLTGNPLHELYDYVRLAEEAQSSLTFRESLVTRAFGLPLYETLFWEKM